MQFSIMHFKTIATLLTLTAAVGASPAGELEVRVFALVEAALPSDCLIFRELSAEGLRF